MMNLTTLVPIPELPRIRYAEGILCMGSCFAEHIGNKLATGKFEVLQNPFGILYNPESIKNAVERMVENRAFDESELFEHNGLWHSWMHHSVFSERNGNDFLIKINSALKKSHDFLKNARTIILTFGTSYVYFHKEEKKVFSNCHKLPAHHFQKKRLSANEVHGHLSEVVSILKSHSPLANIILTVSPVRHIKDGLLDNQRSKATLLLGIEKITKKESNVHYFPSYEIMMDELRDYRFYKNDLIHPTGLAVDIIWQKFQQASMDGTTISNYQKINKIMRGFQHRALHAGTEAHQKFLKRHIAKAQQLSTDLGISFEREIEIFQSRILP